MDGKPLEDRMREARISVAKMLQSARESQGLARMEDIHLAVPEVSGTISIMPRRPG